MTLRRFTSTLVVLALALIAAYAIAQEVTGDSYEVHDMKRPQPPVVTPGSFSTPEQPGQPPSDAIVLFDGKDLSKWKAKQGGGPAEWKVADGYLEAARGKGYITTTDQFGDVQLHVEWMAPAEVKGNSQGRGNSGILLMDLYELQVLDSFDNPTYPDGMAGSVYGQAPPLVNAARKPGEWQVYDAVFRAPKMDEGGKVIQPARMTVFLNGILVQDSTDLIGPTQHKALATYPSNHPAKGPISLQDHGNPVRFRNIWVRPIGEKPKPPIKPAGPGH